MSDRVFGRLACLYAVVMVGVEVLTSLSGKRAQFGDGPLLVMVGLFAAAWFSGTLAIGRGNVVQGSIGILGSTIAFILAG